MINGEEIEQLKNYIGSDGKLVITDDLSEKQKERFQFINSLNINLIDVLTRHNEELSSEDFAEEETSGSVDFDSLDEEILDGPDFSEDIVEDDDASMDDLDSFF